MNPTTTRRATSLTLALALGLLSLPALASDPLVLADPSSRVGEESEEDQLLLPADDGSVIQPIVHGEITTAFPATAALIEFGEAFCTGTLVAPRVVLTAAHCLEEGAPGKVYFGDRPSGDGERIAVESALIYPDYDYYSQFAGDLGLVFLEQDASATPIRMDPTGAEQLIGEEITYVGYGATEGTGGEGRKKAATAMIEDIEGDVLVVQPDDGSACWGDSGGPLYRTLGSGEVVVSGIVSFGYSDDCMDLGGNTRTDLYVDWVTSHIDSAGGGGGSTTVAESNPMERPAWADEPSIPERRGACSSVGGSATAPLLSSLFALLALGLRRRRA